MSDSHARRPVPNRLREYRQALGLDQTDVADGLAALTDEEICLDANAVSRHERGLCRPTKRYRRLYSEFFQVSEAELWPRPLHVDQASDPVLSAPWSHGGTVKASIAVVGSDESVQRRAFLSLTGAALTAPAHQWLVHEPGPLVAALRGDRVTSQLADRLPPMIAELRRMDDVSGGGVALGLAEREFSWVAGLLDGASYDEATAGKLHVALAELGYSTGAAAYDAGLNALAQRYWIAGLRAAHIADDTALGAYILYGMAHQATEQHRPAEAATFIETALAGAHGRQTPALMALLHLEQAKAQATLQDRAACTRAIAKANLWAERIKPEKEPPRLYWVNCAAVTLDNGRALFRLGRYEQAVGPLADGVEQLGGSMVRDRQLHLAELAEALARPGRQRDVEEAAQRAMEAVDLAEGLASTRAMERIRDLCVQMEPHAKVPVVREFLEGVRGKSR
jgi:transcriptional regulator with XRE-family HTH domain